MDERFLYFAYGSNMAGYRLRAADRAPSATAITSGCVRGYQLYFDKVSRDGSGKCTIAPSPDLGERVEGVVFSVSSADADKLDQAEGLGHGYAKVIIEVETSAGKLLATTYIATVRDSHLRPYDWYKEHVVRGAIEHHLSPDYILRLKAVEAISDPLPSRSAKERPTD